MMIHSFIRFVIRMYSLTSYCTNPLALRYVGTGIMKYLKAAFPLKRTKQKADEKKF